MRRLAQSTPAALLARSFVAADPLSSNQFPPAASSAYPAPPRPQQHRADGKEGEALPEPLARESWQQSSGPHTYAEVLEEYVENLNAHAKANTAALGTLRRRVNRLKEAQETFPDRAKRDSFWSFVPVAMMLWLYIRDLSQRSSADYTHRYAKDYTMQHNKVKYVKI